MGVRRSVCVLGGGMGRCDVGRWGALKGVFVMLNWAGWGRLIESCKGMQAGDGRAPRTGTVDCCSSVTCSQLLLLLLQYNKILEYIDHGKQEGATMQ